jgi:hypothetical protein
MRARTTNGSGVMTKPLPWHIINSKKQFTHGIQQSHPNEAMKRAIRNSLVPQGVQHGRTQGRRCDTRWFSWTFEGLTQLYRASQRMRYCHRSIGNNVGGIGAQSEYFVALKTLHFRACPFPESSCWLVVIISVSFRFFLARYVRTSVKHNQKGEHNQMTCVGCDKCSVHIQENQ